MPDEQKPHSFWTSVPGILTGLAALLTAITGLYIAFRPTPPARPPESAAPTVTVSPQPSAKPPDKGPGVVGPPPGRSPGGGVVHPPQASMEELQEGVNYPQHDIDHQPADSAAACAELCKANLQCVAMTFVKSLRTCWIKDSVPAPVPHPDMTSARKLTR